MESCNVVNSGVFQVQEAHRWWQTGSSGWQMCGCIINRMVWHLTASEVMVSSPLAGRQSACGSTEHCLCPRSRLLGGHQSHYTTQAVAERHTQKPGRRQLEIEYRSNVSHMKPRHHSGGCEGERGGERKYTLLKDKTFGIEELHKPDHQDKHTRPEPNKPLMSWLKDNS